MPGTLLHLDGSPSADGFQDERWHDLIEGLDDATNQTYYEQLVEEESTRAVMAALKEVVEQKGRFCALYSDRARHFFATPQASGPVDPRRLTQVGRPLRWQLPLEPAAGKAVRIPAAAYAGTERARP